MGKRKTPIVKTYHIRYISDVFVKATGTQDAYTRADLFMYDKLDEDLELDDIFQITLENDHVNIVPDDYFETRDEEGDAEEFEDETDFTDEDNGDDEDDEDDDEDEDEGE